MFIESCSHPLPRRPQDRPFCLCVTFNLPHAYGCGNMQLRPTDGEIYITRYRDRFNEVPLPATYVPFGGIVEPRLPLDRDELVVVPDLAPTMLNLCGVDIPDSMSHSAARLTCDRP